MSFAGGEEVGFVSVVPCGDAPEILEAAEHALNGVAVAVKEGREAVLPFAIGFGWNVGHRSARLDLKADRAGVIAFISMRDFTIG